jgi:hypothetical protein
MEITIQISYKGYRADYKITSLNSVYHHAQLMDFSGLQSEYPPAQINFIRTNNRAIASSDVITVARDLVKELKAYSVELEKQMEVRF